MDLHRLIQNGHIATDSVPNHMLRYFYFSV